MKKYLKPIVGIILVSIIVFLGYNIIKKVNYKAKVAERIKTIPEFSFLTLANKAFTNNDLVENNYKLFVYFNSECEYCQLEATQISQQLEKLKNTQLIFVSFEPIEGIKQFASEYNLSGKGNVLFLQDKKLKFSEIFDANNIPFILLYSKENNLVQKFKGATKIENILKLLE